MSGKKKRLVVGVSGASGAPLAVRLLEVMRGQPDWETHLVVSRGGAITLTQETGLSLKELLALADYHYENDEIGAAIASGSFQTEGMAVVPCSMKTVAGIHSGYADSLLLRAADIMLKERRRLVLVARETPLSTIHLKNMYELSQAGAIILPPMLTYYSNPEDIPDMTHHIICKILSLWGIQVPGYRRWNGLAPEPAQRARGEGAPFDAPL